MIKFAEEIVVVRNPDGRPSAVRLLDKDGEYIVDLPCLAVGSEFSVSDRGRYTFSVDAQRVTEQRR